MTWIDKVKQPKEIKVVPVVNSLAHALAILKTNGVILTNMTQEANTQHTVVRIEMECYDPETCVEMYEWFNGQALKW